MLMVKCRVVYAKSAVLSSPINKLLDLQKCVDCLRNNARMYGCYLTQCVLYRVYWQLDTLLPLYIMHSCYVPIYQVTYIDNSNTIVKDLAASYIYS